MACPPDGLTVQMPALEPNSNLPLIRCPGCGAHLPDVGTGTHPHIGASSGCWAKFGEVQAKEFADYRYGAVRRLTVDTYAAQHPGVPSAQSVRSVAIHLMALCLVLEREANPGTADAVARLSRRDQAWWWVDPPAALGDVTVLDVIGAAEAQDHADRVRRWASSVWAAWSAHHGTVRTWLDRVLRKP